MLEKIEELQEWLRNHPDAPPEARKEIQWRLKELTENNINENAKTKDQSTESN